MANGADRRSPAGETVLASTAMFSDCSMEDLDQETANQYIGLVNWPCSLAARSARTFTGPWP